MLQSRIVEGIDELNKLKRSWDALSESVACCRLTQTFQWCRVAWETREVMPGERLVRATMWEGPRLVAIWPFRIIKSGLATRIAPMGCTMQEEYGDPLIASNVDQEHVCAHLIELVRNTADVLEVYSTRQGDPIQRLLDRTGLFNIPKPMSAYSVMKTGADSFDDFLRGYSRKFRSNLKQQRKRLETLGVLRFELPDDIESSSETVDTWELP